MRLATGCHEFCDLLIRIVDKDNAIVAKYLSYFALFRARLPLLSSPYENDVVEAGRTLKVSF